ncbi:hypothetical protein [Janthinobacterium sp. PC23-8]|uniref:hypothetical protein n=1 Tax=Janthinobacterium sp. PC23-8 TaxID=2012679 RepID=UPI000B962905|nr:hypothetical protein [Janthinobacterium sp. PC23-8]OYO28994.1 hypothetical protein CD932_17860 [Janthinobacterium sp. PC23-8]
MSNAHLAQQRYRVLGNKVIDRTLREHQSPALLHKSIPTLIGRHIPVAADSDTSSPYCDQQSGQKMIDCALNLANVLETSALVFPA